MSRKKAKSKAAKAVSKAQSARTPSKGHAAPRDAYTPRFSLLEEASWASSHRSTAFDAGRKLRHLPVQFVSAGQLEGTIRPRPQEEAATLSDSPSDCDYHDSPAPSSPSSCQHNTSAMAHMAIRSPSPAPSTSSSSADEVVFRGRNTARGALSKAASKPALQPAAGTTGHVSEHHIDADTESLIEHRFTKRWGDKPAWEGTTTAWEHRSKPGIGWMPARNRADPTSFVSTKSDSQDPAIEDYMQNIEEAGLIDDMIAASGFARRELDLDAGSHNDWESVQSSQRNGNEEDDPQANDSWDSDMLHDFADMSTSSDVSDTVVRILSKRTRQTGLQYLCVYQNSVIDDARWLPANFLKRDTEEVLVRNFEEAAALYITATSTDSEATDENEDEDEDDGDDVGEELDDETLARVLQKQEELGLGSEQVLLYGGDEYFDPQADFIGFGSPQRKRQSRKRGSRDPSFPSASAMADALAMDPYGGFDIMDTDRPSLKPKKKGRRGQMPPELDAPELNEQLQNAWEADRRKKRLKKAEREELRQQGLLGRKGKSPNLKVKYKGGVVMEDVVDEIGEFLRGDTQSLSLPPMEAHRRAIIHQLANFFKLSSRSRGDGHDRFTILSKTTKTRFITEDEFEMIVLSKGFQKRLHGSSQHQKRSAFTDSSAFRSGKRSRPQVGYQDGETVGANAPELGPENRGHALMMKMGWSKGMALGTTDNQGILHPIPHTVKTNKAGLR